MDMSTALDSHVAKWRTRWPEWALAQAFVPVAQRETVAAWFALVQELTDAAWGGADPTPGLAKLAWWQEELTGWSRGARRHPLGGALQRREAPWALLARSLPSLQASRARPGEELRLAPALVFPDAVASCEQALFADGGADAGPGAVAVVRLSLHGEHRLCHPETLVPGGATLPKASGATRPRRIHAGLVASRLDRPGEPLPPWRALLVAWRAARGG
jgi:hypothetical protein